MSLEPGKTSRSPPLPSVNATLPNADYAQRMLHIAERNRWRLVRSRMTEFGDFPYRVTFREKGLSWRNEYADPSKGRV